MSADRTDGIGHDRSRAEPREASPRDSERQLRTLFENLPDLVSRFDREGRHLYANPMVLRAIGKPVEYLLGRTPAELGAPEDAEANRELMAAIGRTVDRAEATSLEMTFQATAGSRCAEVRLVPELDAAGQVASVIGIARDITDRRLAEADARVREQLYRTLAENTPDFIVRWDRDLRRVFVNPAFARAIGTTPEKLVGTLFATHYEPPSIVNEALRQLGERIRAVFATGLATELDTTFFTVDGPRICQLRLVPERDAGGTVATVLGVSRDITEIKENERQIRSLTEHSPDMIARFDREGRYLYANSALGQFTGVPARQFVGHLLGELTATGPQLEVYRDLRERIVSVAATGTPVEIEIPLVYAEDEKVFNVRFIPESDDEQAVASVLMVARDITERQRAIQALRASEQRFRQVTENIDEVFWLVDAGKQEMIYVSPAYERVYGRSCASLHADPRSWLDAILPADRARVEDAAIAQATCAYDVEYRILRDGEVRWIHDRAFPIRNEAGEIYRIAGVAEDVSVRRQLESQLRQAQKMEAVGQLAGGIAHDFNNLLAVIQMQSSLLERAVADPRVREGLQEILLATDRAADLTRQLLTFSRRQVPQPTDHDVSDTIGNVMKLMRRLLGENISLETRFAPGLPLVHADPGMMEQVVMNLAINARDAMPDGGRLTVALEVVTVSQERAALHAGASGGRHVCLTVADTGCGISPETLPRIFEPFFTTKEVGRGTGLGLATVFGIVEQHQGWIEVDSLEGEGTSFKVFLPALSRAALPAGEAEASADAPGGHETILLVEDEPAVRALTRTVLERYGYRVIEAETAVAALARWEREPMDVDLLLTDLVMPGGMSGRDLAEELVTRAPRLRVMYTSGYTAEVVGRLLRLDPGVTLLQKPCTALQLATTVRKCLDRGR